MTTDKKSATTDGAKMRPSLLPFDPADLIAMRMLPSEFARIVGVSKQSVSQWIKRGTITLGPDGRLNPKIASREVMANTDPARLRARVFKQASASHEELRQRVRELEAELADERDYGERREKAAGFRAEDKASRAVERLFGALGKRWLEAVVAHDAGRWERWTDELIAVEFYGLNLAEYRADYSDSEADTTGAADVAGDPCQPAESHDAQGL